MATCLSRLSGRWPCHHRTGSTVLHALLVDDHHLFRQGLKFLLADLDPEIVFSEADSSARALEFAGAAPIDLVLVDLHMPGANGMDALSAMREAFDSSAVVVLSSEDDPRAIRKAIELGACGFVPKSSTPQVLIAALRLVLAGGTYLPPHVLREWGPVVPCAAAPEAARADPVRRPDGLSDRQLEVLLKAIQGKANKVIAREMHLSEGTIKAHLSAAFRALGVQNRTEAVFVAAKVGLTVPAAAPAGAVN
jgi:DNA-binding NarL/FixJ family response regulator